MDWAKALLVFCAAAGLVMVCGSLLLLWRRIINLKAEPGAASNIDLLGFKISAQVPALVLFFFGVFLLTFPIFYAKNVLPQTVSLKAPIKSPTPVTVFAVVAREDNIRNDVILKVPVSSGTYRLMITYGDEVQFSDPFEWTGSASQVLDPIEVQPSTKPTVEVARGTRVAPDKVDEFKNVEAIQP